ncbi:MAG: cytochrome c oxidase subunit 3 [Candidatus Omnitrophica bacterium]|nr:cytochrome c oxidase subunit 3 [Candidatus Omnitrophota bacterium]
MSQSIEIKDNTTTSVGVLIGLSAWSITFVTLIWGYMFYRVRGLLWLEDYIDGPIYFKVALNTGFLICSSFFLHLFLQQKEKKLFLLGLSAALLFIIGQWNLWQALSMRGLTVNQTIAGSFFYLLTGFHALHIIIGMGVLIGFYYLSGMAQTKAITPNFKFVVRFWDLLLLFWLILVPLIFILK